jgi:hypothetical protein
MGESEDQRDMRDRLIRLEEKDAHKEERLKGIETKMWAVVALVLAFVGKQLLALIGGVP